MDWGKYKSKGDYFRLSQEHAVHNDEILNVFLWESPQFTLFIAAQSRIYNGTLLPKMTIQQIEKVKTWTTPSQPQNWELSLP
jgi:hypothetical protein